MPENNAHSSYEFISLNKTTYELLQELASRMGMPERDVVAHLIRKEILKLDYEGIENYGRR